MLDCATDLADAHLLLLDLFRPLPLLDEPLHQLLLVDVMDVLTAHEVLLLVCLAQER